jgi:hypothetical protein
VFDRCFVIGLDAESVKCVSLLDRSNFRRFLRLNSSLLSD